MLVVLRVCLRWSLPRSMPRIYTCVFRQVVLRTELLVLRLCGCGRCTSVGGIRRTLRSVELFQHLGLLGTALVLLFVLVGC